MGRQQQEPLMGLNILSGLGTLRDTPGRVGGATGLPLIGRIHQKTNKKKPNKLIEANGEDTATQATRGSYFLAEGWLVVSVGLLWEDQRLQRGLTPHSVSVIGSFGLPAEGDTGGVILFIRFSLEALFFLTTTQRFHNMATRGGIFTAVSNSTTYPALTPNAAGSTRPPAPPPTTPYLFTPL